MRCRERSAPRRDRISRRNTKSLLCGLLAALALWVPGRAVGCGEAYSRCISLDSAPAPTGPSQFIWMHSLPPEALPRLWADFNYQRRPLVVLAASPDPFGREVPVLSDWVTTRFGFDRRWGEGPRLGLVVPLALRLSGTGIDGVASSRSRETGPLWVGDPTVHAGVDFTVAGLRGLVLERVQLPVGQEGGFVSHRGVTFAPGVALAHTVQAFTFALEVGARLRAPERFGDVRFGSEGLLGFGVARELGKGFSVSVEGFASPALATDESSGATNDATRVRRIPAEFLVSGSMLLDRQRVTVGAGTSLPMSTRRDASETETIAGPPGALLRVSLRLEQALESGQP